MDFEHIWQTYIVPLAGQDILLAKGEKNHITKVTNDSLTRISINGRSSSIKKTFLKDVYDDLISKGILTRSEINNKYKGRRSSITIAVLSKIPGIELISNPAMLKLIKSSA